MRREADGLERSAEMVLLLHGCNQERSDDTAHELVYSRSGGMPGISPEGSCQICMLSQHMGMSTMIAAYMPIVVLASTAKSLPIYSFSAGCEGSTKWSKA